MRGWQFATTAFAVGRVLCVYSWALYRVIDEIFVLSRVRTPSSLHGTVSQLGADQSRLLEAVQSVRLYLTPPDWDELLLIPVWVFWGAVSLFTHIMMFSSFLPISFLHSRSVFVFSPKGIWQPETVWLQRTTQWRSVILGCPGSMTMVCTWQRVVSGRFLLNGRLPRLSTTVGQQSEPPLRLTCAFVNTAPCWCL